MILKWSLHHHLVTYSKLVHQKPLRKALLFVLLSVSDYKHSDTSLYFIITNLHTEFTPQRNARHEFSSIYNAIHTQARNWSATLENFSSPPGKMLNIFYSTTIRHSLRHLSSSQKTLRPPGVPSWLWDCIHSNERRKG